MKRVMFYCQHVLGIGHLVRSAEVARALATQFLVLFVTGGELPDEFCFPSGFRVSRLTPLRTSKELSDLQVCDPSISLAEATQLRREQLVRSFDAFAPDALITELFPFGRKQFSFELIPLLERARACGTAVVSSVRDILVTKTDQARHEQRVVELVHKFYDLILVHGDDSFQPLDETFSRLRDFNRPVRYTGYVVSQDEAVVSDTASACCCKPTIAVSNGGGRCEGGQLLLESAIGAALTLQERIPHRFKVFAGPFMPPEIFERLQKLAGAARNIELAKYTPDLRARLRAADLSISMGGYNTIMDVLRTGVRALVYPETPNGDREQNIRARKLAQLGVLEVLDRGTLESGGLASAILRALQSTPRKLDLNLAGAANTTRILHQFLRRRGCLGNAAGDWSTRSRQYPQ